jgi:hypothetical protein
VRRWTLPDVKYEPGFFGGEVIEAAWDIDDDDDMKPVIGFRVKLDRFEEPCWCWHKCYGTKQNGDPHLEKTRAIVEAVVGSWDNADRIAELAPGKRVTVGVFHNTTDRGKVYENCYIVIGGKRRGAGDPEKVATAVSKLTGKLGPTGLPF